MKKSKDIKNKISTVNLSKKKMEPSKIRSNKKIDAEDEMHELIEKQNELDSVEPAYTFK